MSLAASTAASVRYRKTRAHRPRVPAEIDRSYPDGTRLFFNGRNMPEVHNEFASYIHGSKGSAAVSTDAHAPGRTRIYRGQNIPRWQSGQKEVLGTILLAERELA